MSADIENTVITSVNKSKIFAMQVDDSTDIGGKASYWHLSSMSIMKK